LIVDCVAPPQVLRERLLARKEMHLKPTSPCSIARATAEPLTDDELARVYAG
jgi:hypothetical protein